MVRIADFLEWLPVRKQAVLKMSGKILARTKELLRAYALARPGARFSLKILKADNDKANWIYGPKPGATVVDAVLKVMGKGVVDQCEWKVWNSLTGFVDNDSASDPEGFTLRALLPSKDCGESRPCDTAQD